MKRFGSIFPFVERDAADLKIGRLVANHDFAKALVRYGRFEEIVFSGPSIGNLQVFRQLVATWADGTSAGSNTRFADWMQLQRLMAEVPFHVMHLGGWGHFASGLHYLRSHHAAQPWPITAVIHSLNGRHVIDHAVRLTHAQMAPYDAVFCTSRDGRAAFERLLDAASRITGRRFQGRLELLPLGLDDDLVDQLAATTATRSRACGAPEATDLRGRLRIDPGAIAVLALGRITPAQKMDLGPLLRTFAVDVLPAAGRPVALVIAGSATPGDLRVAREHAQSLGIEAHVHFYANFPPERKTALLAMADILVAPVDNTQETFGLGLLEAHAAGLPVVASNFDGFKDLVIDGEDGYLVDTIGTDVDVLGEWFDVSDPNVAQLYQAQSIAIDCDQLADRLVRLIRDPELRHALGRAGQRKVAERYRFSAVLRQYEATWDALQAEARATGILQAPTNPWSLSPAVVFPHYPSRTLGVDDVLVATVPALDQRPYLELTPVLTADLLGRLVARAQKPISLGDLLGLVPEPPAAVHGAVVWLLKYGQLRRLSCDSSAPASVDSSRAATSALGQ